MKSGSGTLKNGRVHWRATAIIGAAIASSLGSAASGAAPSPARTARIERDIRPTVILEGAAPSPQTIAERMAFYKTPGLSVAFVDAGQISWTKQYGLADTATRRPVTAQTRFQAGSVSKVVAALAALRLVREGRLSLDGDVNAQFVRWKVPDTEFTASKKVTVRGLLSHSAGVTVHGFPGYRPGDPLPTTLQILAGAKPANSPPITVDKVPGGGFRYSGGGYVILQQLIEDVTKEPFPEVVQSRVLKQAGMDRSLVAAALPSALKSSAALGYATDASVMNGGAMQFPELAPAGLWSTPTDLAHLVIEMNRELDGASDRILDKPLMAQMMTRQAGGFGLGVDLGSPDSERSFSHNGANPGFSTLIYYLPDRHQGVAIMANGAEQSGFVYEVAAAIAREYGWSDWKQRVRTTVSLAPEQLKRFEGTWLADGAPEFQVGVKDDHLFVKGGPFGPELVDLYAQSETSFFILSTGLTFDFDPVDNSRAKLIGGTVSAVKIRPAAPG